MPRSLCLTRHCLGLITRIECVIRPLAGENGLWVLICGAGMAASQPSAIKTQGPFHGPLAAEEVMYSIAANLAELGYCQSDEPAIWCLHLQAELRRVNARRGRLAGDYQLRPET